MQSRVFVNPTSRLELERPDITIATARGIDDVQRMQSSGGSVFTWGPAGRRQISDIVDSRYDQRRGQVNLELLLSDIGRTNMAEPSVDNRHYIVTDRDMFAEGTNFVFGITSAHQGVAIQSLMRFMSEISNHRDQATMARHIARHEYAHMIGMNSRSDYAKPDTRGGIYEGHCANTCTVSQVMSVRESVRLVNELDFYTDAGFCGSCVKRIRSKV